MTFRDLASATSFYAGRPVAFLASVAIIILWAATGPLFGYSDTWQLVINTGTTVVTFLMVFLIQATQNRDAAAIHLKLDELLRAVQTARNTMIAAETFADEKIEELKGDVRSASQSEANSTQ
jgi:low affinity Fe/Cu permease